MCRRFGPGLIVTAAFVGPGTITTATKAGASFGFALVWVLGFAVIAAIVLQEMSARIGLVTRAGLGEALRHSFAGRWSRALMIVLVVGAIAVGNAAFEVGNITGAAMGAEALVDWPRWVWALIIGSIAFGLLAVGGYRTVERVLVGLVAAMSVLFVVTMLITRPDWGALLSAAARPSMPPGSALLAIALIGTTVVPYNLFLHASVVSQKWHDSLPLPSALWRSRVDTAVSIALGGSMTLAIVITASVAFDRGATVVDARSMALQLEPLLGSAARYCFSAGLLVAGITSAITAPLAAAYATAGVLGWPVDTRDWRLRFVWAGILVTGTLFAATGTKPVAAIVFAQAINGMILPVLAIFLLVAVNRSDLLGEHRNRWASNLLGVLVVVGAGALGTWNLLRVLMPAAP